MKLSKKDWLDIPVVSLLVANAIPVWGVSFVQNYLLKREYATAKPDKLIGSPYGRVVAIHIAILAGGFLTMAIGFPAPMLVVLVVLKTVLDVSLHNREHKKAKTNAHA